MSQSQPDDANTFKIMVSTDNHLGVWERDEWRSEDSFETFSEVLSIAKAEAMDLVLLGGDLFHENKPSRKTLINTLQIMHKHCLGMEPVAFQVVSDTALIQSGVDNTQDPCLNVGMPVFTIHGNHDDPSGPEHFSAVDVLSSIHYVNYFGKHTFCRDEENDIGKIKLSPLLLVKAIRPVLLCFLTETCRGMMGGVRHKGETKIAIYGLGFMREERLARAFQMPGQVVWLRPTEQQESWFNIFVLHQNRVQHYKIGPGQKARSIQEADLPEWLDMIVWGHEHECKLTEEESKLPNKAFNILQPGSTVATSLSEPESKSKACFCLEICNQAYRLTPRPLRSVRPFKFKAVSLAELGAEPGNHAQIEELLMNQVNDLIEQVEHERAAAPTDPLSQPLGPSGQEQEESPPKLPLIRLRVDYTGFSTIHTLRFGQRFVNRVANPSDILLWAKSSVKRQKQAVASSDIADLPAALDDTQIEDLVSEFAGTLEIVPAPEIGVALKRFVDKDEKQSLNDTFDHILSTTQKAALESLATPGEDEAMVEDGEQGEIEAHKRVVDAVHQAGKRLQEEAEQRLAEEGIEARVLRESAANAATDEAGGDDASEQDGDESEEAEPRQRKTTQKKTGAGRGSTRGGTTGRGRGSRGGGAAGRGTAGTSQGPSAKTKGRKAAGKSADNAQGTASLTAYLTQDGQRTQARGASGTLAQQRLRQAGLHTQPTQARGASRNSDEDMHDDLEDPIEDSDEENVQNTAPQRQRKVVSDSDEDFVVMDGEEDVPSSSRQNKRAKVGGSSAPGTMRRKR